LDRLFQADFEDGTLEALSLSPFPLEAIVAIKIIAHWITTGLPLVILSPLMALMMQLPTEALGWMLVSLTIGTLSLSAIGAIGAALTLGVRRGGLLLTLLVAPLFIPTLIFGVDTVQNAASNLDPITPCLLLSGLTLFALVLGPLTASYALRVNMS
jgi:heme exporter protein B